eukprot:GHUV01025654.1.p1 GENE.GHUV01025654.1~~GHUV01025654.1.p1  ORF type:complete len:1017 (+),score=433.17 GHUV01025654.1:749-3799(+)
MSQQVQQLQPVRPTTASCDGRCNRAPLVKQGLVLQPVSRDDQQHPLSSSGVSSDQSKYHITHRIKSCGTWQEVALVVGEYGPVLNHIHVSAAITHLAQLSRRPDECNGHLKQPTAPQQHGNVQLVPGVEELTQQMAQQHRLLQLGLGRQLQQQHVAQQSPHHHSSQDHLLQWLLDQAVDQLPSMQSRQVANILWSLAQLRYPWQASQRATVAVAALTDRAAQLFHTAESQHLANMAYGAARLQLHIGQEWVQWLQDAWLASAQQYAQQNVQQRNQQQRQGSSGLWGTSKHPGGPGPRELQPSPQATANFMWALAHFQQQPQQAWVQQQLQTVAADLQQWPARSVAVVLWSCAKLGFCFQPRQQHRPAAAASIQQRQQAQSNPEADLGTLLVQVLQQQSQQFSTQDVAQVLWAAAVMKLQLPGPVLQQLLVAGGKQLHPVEGQQRAARLVSSAALIDGAIAVPATPAGVAHSVSLVLWSLARQGVTAEHQLPPRLLKPWLTALIASSPAADSQSLASAAWALCRLQLVGSCPRVLQAMVQAAAQQLLQQQQQLGSICRPAAGCSIVSSRAVASLVWAAGHCLRAAADTRATKQKPGRSRQQQHLRQQQRLQTMLHSINPGPDPVLGAALVAATPAAILPRSQWPCDHQALHASVQQLLLAEARLQQQQGHPHQPHQQQDEQPWQQHLTDMAVPDASLRDLSQILWGVGNLQLQLPPAWWQLCFQQLTRLLKQHCSSPAAEQQFCQSLAVVVWGLGLAKAQVPLELMELLQMASMQVLHPESNALSPLGHVMLLVGFTRICTAMAYRLPKKSQVGSSPRVQLGTVPGRQQMQDSSAPPASGRQDGRQEQSQDCTLQSGVHCDEGYRIGSAPVSEQQQTQIQDPDVLQPGVTQQHRWVTCAGLQPAWLHHFCTSAGCQLQQLPPDALVSLMWALGRLRYHPGSHFLVTALQRVQALLPQCSARHLSLLMWSLTRLQHSPEHAWVQQVLQAWEPLLASASKADTQQMGWALKHSSTSRTL